MERPGKKLGGGETSKASGDVAGRRDAAGWLSPPAWHMPHRGHSHRGALAMPTAFVCVGRQGRGYAGVRCRGGERGRGTEAGVALKTR